MTPVRDPRLKGKPTSEETLLAELRAMRVFLQPVWSSWLENFHPNENQEKKQELVSLYAASFLAKTLGPGWACVGGDPQTFNFTTCEYEDSLEGGFKSENGWTTRWWVVCGSWIADIGTSQAEDVVLTTTEDPRYRSTYNENDIFIHKKNTRQRVQAWHVHWIENEAQRVLALRAR